MQPLCEAGLIQRGIFQAAVKIAAWKSHTYNQMDGWLIPTQALDGSAGRARFKPFGGKTQWLPGQAPLVPYYIPQGRAALESAIQAANGVLYIVEGETDLLTFLELGFYNVLSPSSGINSPLPSLVDDLRDLRVKHVVQSCDNDKAGLEFGAKIRRDLDASGITHEARVMRTPWGELVKDVNELLQAVEFDPAAMLEALENAPAAQLPTLEAEKPKTAAKRPTTAQDGTFKERVRAAVNVLAVYESRTAKFKHKKSGDDLIAMACCPFHNDKTPSLAVYADGGCTCRGACRKSWDLFGFVMERDGIDFPAALDLLAGLAGIERSKVRLNSDEPIDLEAAPDGTKTHQNALKYREIPRNTADTPAAQGLTNVSNSPTHARDSRRAVSTEMVITFLNLKRGGWRSDHAAAIAAYMAICEMIQNGVMDESDSFGALELMNSPRQLSENFARKGLEQLEAAGFLEAAGSEKRGRGKPRQLWALRPEKDALETFEAKKALAYREQEFGATIPAPLTAANFPDLNEAAALEAAQIQNDLRAPLFEDSKAEIEKAESEVNRRLSFEQRAYRWKGVQMEPGAWSNAAAFRRWWAKHQATYRMENGKTLKRSLVARELGVNIKTVTPIRQRAEIAADPQYIDKPDTPDTPETYVHELVTSDGESIPGWASKEEKQEFRVAAMERNQAVFSRLRLPSKERFQTEEEKDAIAAALEAKKARQKPSEPRPAVKQLEAVEKTPAPDLISHHSTAWIDCQNELAQFSPLISLDRDLLLKGENSAKSENEPELDPAGGGSEIPFSSPFFGFSEESPTTGGDRKSSGKNYHLIDPAPDTPVSANWQKREEPPAIPTPAQLIEAAQDLSLTWEASSPIERSRIGERANEIRLGIDRANSLVWARLNRHRPGVLEGVA